MGRETWYRRWRRDRAYARACRKTVKQKTLCDVVVSRTRWVDGPRNEQRYPVLTRCDQRLVAQILLVRLSQSHDELRGLRCGGGGPELFRSWLCTCTKDDRARLRATATRLAMGAIETGPGRFPPLTVCILLGSDLHDQKKVGVLRRVAASFRGAWAQICYACDRRHRVM